MKLAITTLIAVIFATLPASANKRVNHPGHAAASACKADIDKLCGAHKGNRKAMKECVKSNKDKFSAECKAVRADRKAKKNERRAQVEKALETCSKDSAQLCGADKGKKGKELRCLMKNRDKLSAECQAALPEKRVKKHK